VTITRAPASASAAAIAAPKPLLASVISARAPSRRIGTVVSLAIGLPPVI
jgi:hypothetical protein